MCGRDKGHDVLGRRCVWGTQVAALLDKYGEYIDGDNDNNTRIIKEALDTHTKVSQSAGQPHSQSVEHCWPPFPAVRLVASPLCSERLADKAAPSYPRVQPHIPSWR